MKGRRSPIDRMRELADDGLEPWQIAAALGVREDAVLVALAALAAAEPPGGAQRAVEDAASLVGKTPDTLGPTRPMTRALAEHVAVTVCGPDDEASEPEQIHKSQVNFHHLDPSAIPSALVAAHQRAMIRRCYCTPHPCSCEHPDGNEYPAPSPQIDVTPGPITVHVHDPFPVADEAGVWHAECECGHRWDRQPCEAPGCTAYVAALHIARTGTRRHAHHPA